MTCWPSTTKHCAIPYRASKLEPICVGFFFSFGDRTQKDVHPSETSSPENIGLHKFCPESFYCIINNNFQAQYTDHMELFLLTVIIAGHGDPKRRTAEKLPRIGEAKNYVYPIFIINIIFTIQNKMAACKFMSKGHLYSLLYQ